MVGILKAAEPRGRFSPENASPEEGRLLWPEKSSLLKAAGLVDSTPILMEAVGECVLAEVLFTYNFEMTIYVVSSSAFWGIQSYSKMLQYHRNAGRLPCEIFITRLAGKPASVFV